jgi:DNA polymerase (family X)
MKTSNHNQFVADRLREAASLLEQQGANRFRVAAYRKAAEMIDSLEQDITLMVQADGFRGLMALRGIGPQIARAIGEMVRTGRWMQLERLRGTLDPEWLFSQVPGIGPRLAQSVVDELHIDTLEALEVAVHNGRLDKLPGFGARRVAMVRTALAELLGQRRPSQKPHEEPGVDVLLDVDREYREKAAANKLRHIAPRRFNPQNEAWLPVLHTERGHWQFTVLFSNTGLAHQLGRTRDWVVIYFQTDSHAEGQRTVVTETQGPLEGKRVVRGRERECGEEQPLLWPQSSNVA